MNEEILINITPQETRVALIQQGAVQELQIERTRQRGIVGNIYLAKVVRVLPGMQSAFIEIGPNFDKSRLHARQHSDNLCQIDIANNTSLTRTLNLQFLNSALLNKCNARFLRGDINQNFFIHIKVIRA